MVFYKIKGILEAQKLTNTHTHTHTHTHAHTHTHTHTNYVFLQFLISFLNLNHLRDLVDGLFIL